ncbi:MAG: MSHA biogenesis protein MshJ [Pseudomonadota bacterium]|jgi:MSHA biogenesis protein MshJ|nr:MSHA biogenesis protein MshJ [Pseudomonadota bacterium]
MTRLRQWYERGAGWYNDRPVRERGLIAVTAVVLVFVLSWELVMAPALADKRRLIDRRETLSNSRNTLLAEQQTLTDQLTTDPSAQLRRQLQARRERLSQLDRQISETSGQLIAPQEMVALLKNMLAAQEELQLRALVLREPVAVFDSPQPAADAGDGEGEPTEPLLYAHDVELTVAGGYLAVLSYLQQLEAMDSRLGWMRLSYQVDEWPVGEARIRVRTLSLDAAWLGV